MTFRCSTCAEAYPSTDDGVTTPGICVPCTRDRGFSFRSATSIKEELDDLLAKIDRERKARTARKGDRIGSSPGVRDRKGIETHCQHRSPE